MDEIQKLKELNKELLEALGAARESAQQALEAMSKACIADKRNEHEQKAFQLATARQRLAYMERHLETVAAYCKSTLAAKVYKNPLALIAGENAQLAIGTLLKMSAENDQTENDQTGEKTTQILYFE